jgi:hypothetical protein
LAGDVVGRVLAQDHRPDVQADARAQHHRQRGQGAVVLDRVGDGVGGAVEQQQHAVRLVDLAPAPRPEQRARDPVVRCPDLGHRAVAEHLRQAGAVHDIGQQQGLDHTHRAVDRCSPGYEGGLGMAASLPAAFRVRVATASPARTPRPLAVIARPETARRSLLVLRRSVSRIQGDFALEISADRQHVTNRSHHIGNRVAAIDWQVIAADLDAQGWAVLPKLLSDQECVATAALYDADDGFRSRVVMAQHGFGRGEYRYFAYPLPPLVEDLRGSLYRQLVPIANRWHEAMSIDVRFPRDHATFIERCHTAGQTRPTPLLLRYGEDDYNCLHQDLYGEHVFPLQAAALLSEPGADFDGGELVLTEQRPRMQTRAAVVPLTKGDAVVFAVNSRPVQGTRGSYRVKLRHGVSALRSGDRHTLGIIFHDAT